MKKFENTVKKITDNDLCLSCGYCEPACPEKCIEIKFNPKKGYHEPFISYECCTECTECMEVCPGTEVDFPKLNEMRGGRIPEYHHIGITNNTQILYSSDSEIRKDAASGGFITQLILNLLDTNKISGAFVAKPSKENPFDPQGFIAHNKEELRLSQMSIYNSVPVGKKIDKILDEKGKVLLVGLPCQIHAFLKYSSKKPELLSKIHAMIGTFCGGYQTSFAHQYYFPKLNIDFNKVKYIDYRYGEFPGQFNLGFKDGSEVELKRRFKDKQSKNLYNSAFNSYFYLPRCLTCADKGAILADISAGDPWLPRFADEKLGKSLVLSRTNLGQQLIDNAVEDGYLIREDATFKDIMEVQKLDRERHGNQPAYERIYKFFGKPYPKYNYLGKPQVYNWRIYLRAFFDFIKPYLQRNKKLWFLIKPSYFIEKHIRNILIYDNPISYIKKKIK